MTCKSINKRQRNLHTCWFFLYLVTSGLTIFSPNENYLPVTFEIYISIILETVASLYLYWLRLVHINKLSILQTCISVNSH